MMEAKELRELRALCDAAMKTLSMLPAAVATADDDPEWVQSIIVDLSAQLASMSMVLEDPDVSDDPCSSPERWSAPNLTRGGATGKTAKTESEADNES